MYCVSKRNKKVLVHHQDWNSIRWLTNSIWIKRIKEKPLTKNEQFFVNLFGWMILNNLALESTIRIIYPFWIRNFDIHNENTLKTTEESLFWKKKESISLHALYLSVSFAFKIFLKWCGNISFVKQTKISFLTKWFAKFSTKSILLEYLERNPYHFIKLIFKKYSYLKSFCKYLFRPWCSLSLPSWTQQS